MSFSHLYSLALSLVSSTNHFSNLHTGVLLIIWCLVYHTDQMSCARHRHTDTEPCVKLSPDNHSHFPLQQSMRAVQGATCLIRLKLLIISSEISSNQLFIDFQSVMPLVSRKTCPGYTLKSQRYLLKLVCAHQFGRGARNVERVVCWWGVMKVVLKAFEKNDENLEKVKHELSEALTSMITFIEDFQVEVNICEDRTMPGPRGETKRVKISLNDRLSTSVEFTIKKRNNIKTLKDICLDFLSKEIKDGLLINGLELPSTLLYSLKTEYYKVWAFQNFPKNSINMLPYREALLMRLEDQREREARQAKKPKLSLHRMHD